MPIVTKDGFRAPEAVNYIAFDCFVADEDLADRSETPEGSALPDASLSGHAVDMPNDADPALLEGRLAGISLIRIAFPTYGDGRGFSLARALRDLGYEGQLRASGYLISDQFRHALHCGFDDVEISDELAERQPAYLWRGEDWVGYREKLAGEIVG